MSKEEEAKPKDLTKDEVISALSAFVKDFIKESDRAAVVVGAAKLDILLRQLLQRFLMPAPGANDELLDTERPLGTFSARIHACHRLGLIDTEFSRALHLVRKIRNEFAHETSSISLSSGSYADRIRELIGPLKDLRTFKTFQALSDLSQTSGGSRDFRVALALLCLRLEMALFSAESIECGQTTALIPSGWREGKK